MRKKSSQFRSLSFRNKLSSAIILVAFVIIGSVLLLRTHAATPYLVLEAENGLKTGKVSAGDTAGASNNGSVSFGTSPAMLFEDDFNGPVGASFDAAKWSDWSTCTYRPNAAYGNIKCGDNEKLDGQGHLVIPATPTAGSSMMTGEKFRFTYGTMSAWIKIPPEAGYWPAFWSLNATTKDPDPVPGGEIDALEAYTTWLDSYHVTVHNWNNNESWHGPDEQCGKGINLSLAYHKYSAKVEPNKVSFFFDDKPCGTVVTAAMNPTKQWGFAPNVTRGNWLLLTLAVGGAGGAQKPATAPAQMLVDRVEVRAN